MNIEELTVGQLRELRKELGVETSSRGTSKGTFLETGKAYLFRTVTMIYTGRIKEMRGDEILLEDAAWIPDTKRWKNSLDEEDFNEVEPYIRDVVLWRGGLLDATEIKKLPLEQK